MYRDRSASASQSTSASASNDDTSSEGVMTLDELTEKWLEKAIDLNNDSPGNDRSRRKVHRSRIDVPMRKGRFKRFLGTVRQRFVAFRNLCTCDCTPL